MRFSNQINFDSSSLSSSQVPGARPAPFSLTPNVNCIYAPRAHSGTSIKHSTVSSEMEYSPVRLALVVDSSARTQQLLPNITDIYIAPIIERLRKLHNTRDVQVGHVAFGISKPPTSTRLSLGHPTITSKHYFQSAESAISGLRGSSSNYGIGDIQNEQSAPMACLEGIVTAIQVRTAP